MSDTPKCEKCGLEITTGMMPALCQYSTECVMWPHSDGTPEGDGAELLMAKLWMHEANIQLGMLIDERNRFSARVEQLSAENDTLLRELGRREPQREGDER